MNRLFCPCGKYPDAFPRSSIFGRSYHFIAGRQPCLRLEPLVWLVYWRGSDPLCISVAVVLQYLADLQKEGYASRSINVHRSMWSMTLNSFDGFKIGDHPLVVQLLKGCFNNNPSRPRYDLTWDPDKVFRYFTSLGDNTSLLYPNFPKNLFFFWC